MRALIVLSLLVSSASADPINAVIGDTSWTVGDPDTGGETERIEAHLTFVRTRLAAADISALSTVVLGTADQGEHEARHRRLDGARHDHVRVRGDARGGIKITAAQTDGFSSCIAAELTRSVRDGGAWDEQPKAYAFDLTLKLPSPQDLFAKALGDVGRFSTCVPRPGAPPREAAVRGTSTKDGLTVTVQTNPRNEEVEACLAERARQNWRQFEKGVWSLTATRTVPVESELAARAECRPSDLSGQVTITVAARPDDEDFTVTSSVGNEQFVTCVRGKLREKLKSQYGVPRKLPDGTVERYFRIDSKVSASATVKL